jgi:hypothetical protein
VALVAAILPILVLAPVAEARSSGPAPRPSARATRIVLLGDSLAHEVSGVVQFLSAPKPVIPKFWGGTAPCDWLGVDLRANRSTVVVVSFTGNSLTPCMSDGAGGYLRGDALVERYRADLTVLVDTARASGARVLLVGQPLRAPSFEADAEVEGINAVYRELAQRRCVHRPAAVCANRAGVRRRRSEHRSRRRRALLPDPGASRQLRGVVVGRAALRHGHRVRRIAACCLRVSPAAVAVAH